MRRMPQGREALDASGARIAALARMGADPFRHGLRLSQAGLALRGAPGASTAAVAHSRPPDTLPEGAAR